MKRLMITVCAALALLIPASFTTAKEYRAPVYVAYGHASDITSLVPGDEVVTTITFTPLIDLDRLEVKVRTEGTELVDTPETISIDNPKAGKQVQVSIKVRLVAEKGRIAINYFTHLPVGTEFGALNICCYGKEKQAPQP